MNNFELNSISVNDVLHTLRECERNGRYEGMFEHMLTFASELTGISEDTLCSSMHEQMNTKISYLYRDADNYKTHIECVINGLLSEEQKKKILDCRQEGEWFIPSQVGLDEYRNWPVDLEVDHPWFELEEYSFSETNEKASVDITAEELVAAFEKCKDKWDEFAWLNDLDIEDEIETKELDNSTGLNEKIVGAKLQQTNRKETALLRENER